MPLVWTTGTPGWRSTVVCVADSAIGEMSVVRAAGKGKPRFIARQKGIPLSRQTHKTEADAMAEAESYVEAKS